MQRQCVGISQTVRARGCRPPSSPRCTPSCATCLRARSRRMEPLPKLRAAARGPSALVCARTARPRPACLDSESSRGTGGWAASAASGARPRRRSSASARFWRAKASSSTRTGACRPRACFASCPRRTTRRRRRRSALARRRLRPSSRRRRSASSRRAVRARRADRRRRRGGSRPRATLLIGDRGCRRRTPRCATWWGAAASS